MSGLARGLDARAHRGSARRRREDDRGARLRLRCPYPKIERRPASRDHRAWPAAHRIRAGPSARAMDVPVAQPDHRGASLVCPRRRGPEGEGAPTTRRGGCSHLNKRGARGAGPDRRVVAEGPNRLIQDGALALPDAAGSSGPVSASTWAGESGSRRRPEAGPRARRAVRPPPRRRAAGERRWTEDRRRAAGSPASARRAAGLAASARRAAVPRPARPRRAAAPHRSRSRSTTTSSPR